MGQRGDELFDVVDDQDRVVRQAPRRDVHAHGWLHRAVHVLVFNRAGEVFLQKRSMAKDMSPGLWDSSCSGHLDAGEDYDAAAWRELQEEIGLKLAEPPARWQRVEACEETGQEFVWVYRVECLNPANWWVDGNSNISWRILLFRLSPLSATWYANGCHLPGVVYRRPDGNSCISDSLTPRILC